MKERFKGAADDLGTKEHPSTPGSKAGQPIIIGPPRQKSTRKIRERQNLGSSRLPQRDSVPKPKTDSPVDGARGDGWTQDEFSPERKIFEIIRRKTVRVHSRIELFIDAGAEFVEERGTPLGVRHSARMLSRAAHHDDALPPVFGLRPHFRRGLF